jgi:hypothetical protein
MALSGSNATGVSLMKVRLHSRAAGPQDSSEKTHSQHVVAVAVSTCGGRDKTCAHTANHTTHHTLASAARVSIDTHTHTG